MRFILIDRILELAPGKSVSALRRVERAEDYFRDHFPGFPVVPGVLLTEMMAQTAGKCLDAEKLPRGKAMLARIRSASFREWVKPDTTLVIHAEIGQNQPRLATAACHVSIDGRPVARADLLFSFVPLERFADGYRDPILDDYFASRKSEE